MKFIQKKVTILFVYIFCLGVMSCVNKEVPVENETKVGTSEGIEDYIPPVVEATTFEFKVYVSDSNSQNILDINGEVVEFITKDNSINAILDQGDYKFRPVLSPTLPNISVKVSIIHASTDNFINTSDVINNNQEKIISFDNSGNYLLKFELIQSGDVLQTVRFSPNIRCEGADANNSFSIYLQNIRITPAYLPDNTTDSGVYLIDDEKTPPYTFSDYKMDFSGILSSDGSSVNNIEDFKAYIDYNGDKIFDLADFTKTLAEPYYITSNYVFDNNREFKVRVYNQCFNYVEDTISINNISQVTQVSPSEDGTLSTNESKLVEYDVDDFIIEDKSDHFINFNISDDNNPSELSLNAEFINFKKSAFHDNQNFLLNSDGSGFDSLNQNRSPGTYVYDLTENINVQQDTTDIDINVSFHLETDDHTSVQESGTQLYNLLISHNLMQYGVQPENQPGEDFSNSKHKNKSIVDSETISTVEKVENIQIPLQRFKFKVLGESDLIQDKNYECNNTNTESSDNCIQDLNSNIKIETEVTTETFTADCKCQEVTVNPGSNPDFTPINCEFEGQSVKKDFWIHYAANNFTQSLKSETTSSDVNLTKIEGYLEIDKDEHSLSSDPQVIENGCTVEGDDQGTLNSCPERQEEQCQFDGNYPDFENEYQCQRFTGVDNCGLTCHKYGQKQTVCELNDNSIDTGAHFSCESLPGTNSCNEACSVQGELPSSCQPVTSPGDSYTCESIDANWVDESGNTISACGSCASQPGTKNPQADCEYDENAIGDWQASAYTCESKNFQGSLPGNPSGCEGACTKTVSGTLPPSCSPGPNPNCINGQSYGTNQCGQQCLLPNDNSCSGE